MNENNTQTNTKRRYTKTTPALVAQITEKLTQGEKPKDIAESLQVSLPLIYKIARPLGFVRAYAHKARETPAETAPPMPPTE